MFPDGHPRQCSRPGDGDAAGHEWHRGQPDVCPRRRPAAGASIPAITVTSCSSTRPPGDASLLAPTLAERLHAQGLRLAGVSSGSTGSAFLLNPRAPAGVGALVNGYLDPGHTVAYPAGVSATILAKFGPAPAKGRERTLRRAGGLDATGAARVRPARARP